MSSAAMPSGIVLEELDEAVRPQDDLYRHVNGKWLGRTEIPDDKARWGSFHQLAEKAEIDVRAIIEEAQSAEPGTDIRKAGDFYVSFLDVERIETLGAEPLRGMLATVDAVGSIDELLRLVGTLDRSGVGTLFGIYVAPDPGNPERAVPFVNQAGISLPDESYYRLDSFKNTRTAFREYVEQVLALAGASDAAAQADAILLLEHEVASHHWDNVRTRDAIATYNLKSWQEFADLLGANLDGWRAAISPGRPAVFAELVVAQPSQVEGLGSLLTAERLDAWKSWLRLRVIRSLSPYLSQAFVDATFAFFGTELSGTVANRERWKRGVSLVEGAMGDALARTYVERHFPPASREAMDALVENLVEAYRQSITTLAWMSDETKAKALDKLRRFTPKVGYPLRWRTFEHLEVAAADLVGNVQRASEAEHDRQLAKVGQPIDRDEWLMTPMTVNAYYHPLLNEIVFPAAILQVPFFSSDRDAAANYGGIGAVIGHEIGHGFDDQGSRFDGTGALIDWWTEADRTAFEERTANLVEQYNALVPKGLDEANTVNGALTIGENIGDLGGLGIALKAYEISLGGEEAPVIDGFTGVQRLMLSWAQVWQQASREAETVRLLAVDPHSPNEFRCNQIVRNLDAYYEAFGVTQDDALWLEPDQRVTIW